MRELRDPTPGIDGCALCPLAWEGRRQVVRGEGPHNPEVMFIGEAPGEEEDRTGRPFVGKAGRLLREILEIEGIPLDKIYISNACRCRPRANRKPKAKEIGTCRSWLEMEIEAIQPKHIVLLGDTALKSLFKTGREAWYREDDGVDKKGKPKTKPVTLSTARRRNDMHWFEIPVTATYHPSAGLRYPHLKAALIGDIRKLSESMGWRTAVENKTHYTELSGQSGSLSLAPVLIRNLGGRSNRVLAIDTEFDPEEHDPFPYCLSLSWVEGDALVVFPKDWGAFSGYRIEDFLQGLIDTAEVVVFHNAPVDLKCLLRLGVTVPDHKIRDTMVMAFLLGLRPLGLKPLVEQRLGIKVIRLEELQGDRKVHEVERDQLVNYSAQDADITLRLYKNLQGELA